MYCTQVFQTGILDRKGSNTISRSLLVGSSSSKRFQGKAVRFSAHNSGDTSFLLSYGDIRADASVKLYKILRVYDSRCFFPRVLNFSIFVNWRKF